MALMRTAVRYFDEATRHGSIRKAADHLHIASSAVNRQILQLEEELGIKLFERLPRGIRATTAGEVLLSYVRRWNREAVSLNRDLGALRGGIRGTIRIAASESFTDELLPRAMRELQASFPQVDFSLISGDNYRITTQLFARDADVVLAYDVSDNVRAKVIATITSPLGVITLPDHPLTCLSQVTLDDCAPYPLVVPGSDWLQHSGLNVLLQEDTLPAHVIARAERPAMLKALVRSGLGIAYLTALGVERDIEEGKLAWTPFAPGVIKDATISLMVPRGRTQPTHAIAFIDILKRELEAAQRDTTQLRHE
ncbi:MAG: LysR family transcriptional regulator [Rhizobiaceae bacterium]|nr:LysR family transcriptional regulator [Rhizobiaceae bacterium]